MRFSGLFLLVITRSTVVTARHLFRPTLNLHKPKLHGSMALTHRMRNMRTSTSLYSTFHAARRGFSSSFARKAQNYYQVMELSENASSAQIKTQYFALSKKYHPDAAGSGSSMDKFHQLTEAYNILSNPHLRREYDRNLSGSESHIPPEQRPRTAADMRRSEARKEARADSKAYKAGTLEYGFSPRSSWPPEFRKIFDQYVKEMKAKGVDITKTTMSSEGFRADPQTLEIMLKSQIMARHLKSAFEDGRVPFGGMSTMQNKAANTWMRNRIAAFERDRARHRAEATGSVHERGGSTRTGYSRMHAGASRYTGARSSMSGETGARQPSYSSLHSRDTTGGTGNHYSNAYGSQSVDRGFEGYPSPNGDNPASRLGGKGTGEETFNSPWDQPPGRKFRYAPPRQWWAGEESETSNMKRDYSKGHVLDPRHEEDAIQLINREGRFKLATYGLVALLSGILAVKALGG